MTAKNVMTDTSECGPFVTKTCALNIYHFTNLTNLTNLSVNFIKVFINNYIIQLFNYMALNLLRSLPGHMEISLR